MTKLIIVDNYRYSLIFIDIIYGLERVVNIQNKLVKCKEWGKKEKE